jgi:hypothetical protein
MERLTVLNRVSSLCASLGYAQAQDPFSFDLQPTGRIEAVFRIVPEVGQVIGGFNYSEERTDSFTFWVARAVAANPQQALRNLVTDCTSLYSAVIHDGASGGGDYAVPDRMTLTHRHEQGQEFAVAQMLVPINYEATV